MTFIGDDSELQDALVDVPIEVDVTIERVEAYEGTALLGPSLLTERQREISEIAV